ncbi:MAG: hypothetical protein AB7K24_04505 [Gemmataceae bacterium]
MLGTIVVDVIDCQKPKLALAAASTRATAIGREYLDLDLYVIAFRCGVLQTTVVVAISPPI